MVIQVHQLKPMRQPSGKVQASCSYEIYEVIRQRAKDGRRSISREVEYILELGLKAAEEKEAA